MRWLVKYDSSLILFHHRYPTSTINVKRAAHPFSTKSYFGNDQYILVHNGHISNSRELRAKHKEMGIKYQSKLKDGSFNDSEALLWDLALVLQGKQSELEARGGIAFICLQLKKGKVVKMHFGRNNNPLNIFRDNNTLKLSSEGEGKPIDPQELYSFNLKAKRLTTRYFRIPAYQTPTPGYKGMTRDNQGNYRPNSYESGNDWWGRDEPKDQSADWGQPADWLPEKLRNKFQLQLARNGVRKAIDKHNLKPADKLEFDYDEEGNIIFPDQHGRYEKRASGLYVPQENRGQVVSEGASAHKDKDEVNYSGFETYNVPQKAQLTEEEQEDMEIYVPSHAEVEARALEYLNDAMGFFEGAYWEVEQDRELIGDDDMSQEMIQERAILDKVMAHIMADPQYIDEMSVSSLWETVWEQMSMQTA